MPLECFKEKNGKHYKFCMKCLEKGKIRQDKYRAANIEEIKRRASIYYRENIEKSKEYTERNKEKIAERGKIWARKNRKKLNNYCNAKSKTEKYKDVRNKNLSHRRKNDVEYKIRLCLRARIKHMLKKEDKSGSSIDLLGCSIIELKKHLESKFKPGMTWENYGFYGWHIDHIIPCAAFDLTKMEEQKKCFHYSNLQPLWRFENQSKGNRIILKTESLSTHPSP